MTEQPVFAAYAYGEMELTKAENVTDAKPDQEASDT